MQSLDDSIVQPPRHQFRSGTLARAAFVALASIAVLAGCASTRLEAEWRDPQLSSRQLRGTRVLVACEASDLAVQRLCEDQVAAGLTARGATPVRANRAMGDETPGESRYLAAAREYGVGSVFLVSISLASQAVSPGFSIGIGGFGFGRHSGGGIGVAAPIGGGDVTAGYAANGRLTDTSSGRLLWTATASTPPSRDINAQLAELSNALLGAADKTGLF